MKTAIVLSIGSRGDTEPAIALASRLLQYNDVNELHLCHFPDYTYLIPDDHRLVSHPLPFSANAFRPIFKRHMIRALFLSIFTGFDIVKIQTAAMGTLVTQHVIPLLPKMIELAAQINPSVVITTTLGFTVAASVGEKFRIPVCLLNFQPNTPTKYYPYYMHGTESAILAADRVANSHETPCHEQGDSQYFETYHTQYSMFIPGLQSLNTMRSWYGLGSMSFTDLEHSICGRRSNVHIINSFCKALVPLSPDHIENVHVVPPLAAAYIPNGWNPQLSCPQVFNYILKPGKPICVTFGSMGSIVSGASITRELLTGLRAAGATRVLVLNSTTDISMERLWRYQDADLIEWAKKHVFITREKPQYSWLLPKCKAIVCHGGAGTTFAALRAGIPVVISPVLCDQFFWGRLVERLGLGAVAGPQLERANRASFESAVRTALKKEVIERVGKFGETERSCNDGANIAAELINSIAIAGA